MTTQSHNHNASVLRRLHLAAILFIGGTISGSLAVLSDAAHLVADLTSFGVAILAGHLAQLPSSDQHTYGLRRTESLAALLSMVSLAIVSLGLAYEAVRRLFVTHDTQVDGPLMSCIALIGVLVNVTLAVVLGEHHVHLPGYESSCNSSHDHSHSHGHHDNSDKSKNSSSCNGHAHETKELSSHNHKHNNTHTHDHASQQQDHDIVSFHHKKQTCNHDHAHHEHHALDVMESGHDHSHQKSNQHTEQTPLLPDHVHEAVPETIAKAHDNVNLRAAYLHVMGDLAQSVAVLIAGIIIYFQPTWTIVDPIATLLFCTMVFASTLPVIRRGMAVLLEEVPPHISWTNVHDAIASVEHVSNVHDLHIWSISDGRPGLTVHGSVEASEHSTDALREIQRVCQSFGITHTTIQLQVGSVDGECITCEGDSLCAARF